MAFIPVENVAQFNIRWTMDGQRAENTLYARRLAGWDEASLIDAAAITKLELVDGLISQYSDVCEWREILATDLTAFDAEQVTYTGGGTVPGSSAGGALPNNVAACISFRTANRGRSYRGRNYIFGLTDLSVSINELQISVAEVFVDAYEAWADDMIAASYIPVVVSRYTANAPRVAGIATNITTYLFTDRHVDSQRRRLPGRGI